MNRNEENEGRRLSVFEAEASYLLSECADILDHAGGNLETVEVSEDLAGVTSNLVGFGCDLRLIMWGLQGIASYLEEMDFRAQNVVSELVGFAQALEDLISDSNDAARTVIRVAQEVAFAH